MNAITNYIGAALTYAGAYAAFQTWRWALKAEAKPEAQPEPDSVVIPWSEIAAPNVFGPRRPQCRPVSRQTRLARLAKLSARCEDIRRRLERGIQAAWREGTRTGRSRMRVLEGRLAVLERRVERLRVMGWTEAAGVRR